MNKLFILLFICSNVYALQNPKVFDSSYLDIEDLIEQKTMQKVFSYTEAKSNSHINEILNDKKGLISKEFKISPYFMPVVKFWFSVYTKYNSNQIIIHDVENVEIVYKLMNFDSIQKSGLNIFTAYHIQKSLSRENTRNIRIKLKKLATKNFKYLDDFDLALIQSLRKAKVKVPLNRKKRKKLFLNLAKNVRYQSGQKDMVLQGLFNVVPFMPFLKKQFGQFKIPIELLALAFVESSFNPKATSKAGASGVWQFIKYTGNIFLPKANKKQDYRNNIYLSTIAALHLLKENKQILKSWDLAITAYNSGTKHLVRARKKFRKKKNLNLEYILEKYNHKHLGFASKNYYAEFLAMVYAIKYKDAVYPPVANSDYAGKIPKIYITKCSIIPKKIARLIKNSTPNFLELNPQFFYPNKIYKRGSIIIANSNLHNKKYYKLSQRNILNKRPHHWKKLIRKKKCR